MVLALWRNPDAGTAGLNLHARVLGHFLPAPAVLTYCCRPGHRHAHTHTQKSTRASRQTATPPRRGSVNCLHGVPPKTLIVLFIDVAAAEQVLRSINKTISAHVGHQERQTCVCARPNLK